MNMAAAWNNEHDGEKARRVAVALRPRLNLRRLALWPDYAPWRYALMLIVAGLVAPGVGASQPSVLLVDAVSGRTLRAVRADAPRYPASLTKMMTLYLLFEALEHKQIQLHSRLRVSRSAAAKPPTALGLRPGRRISVHDAILAITTESANDMAALVAETLAGNERQFARRMTRTALALGMHHTRFGNASGLPHPAHRTTARDMTRLARALLRHYPRYYHFFGHRRFVYAGIAHPNHNRLLGAYRGMDGIKTGYTRASGYNLVASARRGDRRLIGVVMGSASAAQRNQTMTRLLDTGFRMASINRP